MRGVPVTVGGASSPTLLRRLSAVWAAVAVVGIMFSPVGAAQTTQATPSVPQAQTPTADQLKALRQEAEQGNAEAQCQLGTIYEDGQAVLKDYTEAYRWLNLGSMLSADLQNACADKFDRLKRQMPPEQIAKVDKQVEEWGAAVGFAFATLRKTVKPKYTADAKKAKITGDVELDLVIGIDGTVVQCRVVRSLDDGLDQEAIKAVRQFCFAPARIGKRAVPTLGHLVMSFEIKQ
jgi:TonB family protein